MNGGAVADVLLATARDPATWLGLSWTREAVALRFVSVGAWTLGSLAAALVVPRAVARAAEALRAPRAGFFLAGLLFHASAGLTLVLAAGLTSLPAGVSVLSLVALAVAAVRSTGLAAGFVTAGRRIFPRDTASAYARLLAGALVMGLIAFVPLLGALAWLLLASAGTGALFATWRRA